MHPQAVQAAQITFEDYFMADLAIEPLQIVGWEGIFGTFFMVAGQTIIADIFEPVSQLLNTFLGEAIADDIFRSCAGQPWAL